MNKAQSHHVFVSFFLWLMLTSCDSSENKSSVGGNTSNDAPVADAGPDQNVTTGQTVQLNGSESSDANGDSLNFSWAFISIPSSSNSSLSSITSNTPSFTPDVDGTYVVRLIVNDDQVSSEADTVSIISSNVNTPPVADAGPDQNTTTGLAVSLDGSGSSDANNDSLTYSWVFISRPAGSNSSLNNTTSSNPAFTPDVDGTYMVRLIVNDGQVNSVADTVDIISTTLNVAPVADAGPDQNATTGQAVSLDGSGSSDANNDALTYSWQFTTTPSGSSVSLNDASIVNPVFTPDVDGTYAVQLIVNDSQLNSVADTVSIASSSNAVSDDFSGTGELIGYTTNNASDLPDVTRTNGRYRANLVNNAGNITLHFNNRQGRLDAKLVTFPFDYIARNIGIGTQGDSQTPPPGSGNPYIFAGIQVHVPDLESRNSSHLVVGHRGGTSFTIEGKNTVNGSSTVDDQGINVAPDGRSDIRIVGNNDRSLTVYWQAPNFTGSTTNDSWTLYRGTGNLPGTAPVYGSSVYIGLITYAQDSQGLPFVGTCDAIEFIQ